jgi:hypothetical protein
MGGDAFDVPLTAMSRDEGDLGDSWICAFLRLSAAEIFVDHCESVRSVFISGRGFPIPAISRDVVDLGDAFPLCHSERCRSTRDGKRGTPRMFGE